MRKAWFGYRRCRICRKEFYCNTPPGTKFRRFCSSDCVKGRKASKKERIKRIFKLRASNNKSENFYENGKWRVLRYEVLIERGRQCECCGASPTNRKQVHVDHIKPRISYPELEYDKDNLQILCEDCNKGKGAWDETDFRIKIPTLLRTVRGPEDLYERG